MPPPSKKKKYTVKLFKVDWLQSEVDGVLVRSWCVGDPTSKDRARCVICPSPLNSPTGFCSFSIAEGFTAIKSHAKSKKHIAAADKQNNGKNENEPRPKQMRMEESLRNQAEITKAHRKEEENR